MLPNSAAGWLALMQHHGAPTRLLDVTSSPYVAAYFAVEDDGPETQHRVVWAFSPMWCFSAAGKLRFSADTGIKERLREEMRAGKAEGYPRPVPEPSDELLAWYQGALDGKALEDGGAWLEDRVRCVVPWTPFTLTERLAIQQGSFLVPRDVDATFVENLLAMGLPGDRIRRFVLDGTERGRALDELRQMNITRASLFPGLDGVAQSFRQDMHTEPEEARYARLIARQLKGGGFYSESAEPSPDPIADGEKPSPSGTESTSAAADSPIIPKPPEDTPQK
jgi:hypothetical protein